MSEPMPSPTSADPAANLMPSLYTQSAAAPTPRSQTPGRGVEMETKVPHVAAAFWAVKLLTTGMGEAISDWLGGISIPLAAGVGVVWFATSMWLQLRASSYHPARYWSAVASIAVIGTMAADSIHLLGLPYIVTTTFYALGVIVVLALWRKIEGSVSIHTITTPRREVFYWLTVMATFALGTAAGDFCANSLGLGYLASALAFGAAMLVPLAGWRSGHLRAVPAFWLAYILTRPLGASIADWLGKPSRETGLGLTDAAVSLSTLAAFIVVVIWLCRSKADTPHRDEPA